jgi:transposase InsO family protein
VAINYFNKWFEAMSTFRNDEETTPLFVVNDIGATFGIPKEIFIDHGIHFQNKMMSDLTYKLELKKEHSSPYYPHSNG